MKTAPRSRTPKNSRLGKGNKFSDIDLILRSARTCFEQYGVEKTRLEDIAQTAGVSRPLLYKLFNGKQGLTDAMVNYELKRLTELQRKTMSKYHSFKEVLVEGAVAGIKIAREDPVLMDILIHGSFEHLPTLLLDRSKPAHELVLALWKPFFDAARSRGELPDSMEDHDMMEWLMGIQYLFVLRDEASYERIRELLEVFLCPLFNNPQPGS